MEEMKEKLKKEVSDLYNEGVKIFLDENEKSKISNSKKKSDDIAREDSHIPLHMRYQSWYSQALPVVRQLIPERYVLRPIFWTQKWRS